MAYFYEEASHTFSEYLLVPGYSSAECIPSNVSLKTPLVKFKKGEESKISLNVPLVSAIMQSVSDDKMAVALAKEGGISFIYGSQSIEDETDCMIAETRGILRLRGHSSSPFLNLTRGVLRFTFAGMHSLDV